MQAQVVTLRTEQMIQALQTAVKQQNDQQVYKHAKLLIKQVPDDIDYKLCLVLSCIRLNLVDNMLIDVFKSNHQNDERLLQIQAYYLYQQNKYNQAIKLLRNLKNNNNVNLLLAQCLFKVQEYSQSAKIMKQIIHQQKLNVENRQTYLTNILATGINQQIGVHNIQKYSQQIKQNSIRQLLYNYALVLVQMQEYDLALEQLSKFEKQLHKDEDELDIITTMLLKDYIGWKMGNKITQSSVEKYQKLLLEVKDNNLKCILQCNILATRGATQHVENSNDKLKMIDQSLQPAVKMSLMQCIHLKINKVTLLLRKGRFAEGYKLIKKIETEVTQEQLIKNADFLKKKYFTLKKMQNTAPSQVQQFIQSVKKKNKLLAFCLQADYCRERNKQNQLLIQMKEQGEETNSVIKNYIFSLLLKNPAIFDQFYDYLKKLVKQTKDIKLLEILLKIYIKKEDCQKQRAIVQKILNLQPKNQRAKVKMASILLNEGNIPGAEQILKSLDPPEQISDIAYLQHIEKNIHISKKDESEKLTVEEIDPKKQQKKKIKKKRKPKLPKNVDYIQGYKPDPDRWLPKWQRKGYKKKGKKQGKNQGLITVDRNQTKNLYTTTASTSSNQVTKDIKKRKG